MINLLETAARMGSGVGELARGDPTGWRPDDDCECEACLHWLFTGGDVWAARSPEYGGQMYVRGRTRMSYVRRGDGTAADKL